MQGRTNPIPLRISGAEQFPLSIAGLVTLTLVAIIALATGIARLPMAHGLARYFDFPRVQLLVLALPAALGLVTVGLPAPLRWGAGMVLALAVADQLAHVLRFTPLWRKQSLAAPAPGQADARISVMTCNVKMSNRDYGRLARLAARVKPDILILMEVDAGWLAGLTELRRTYGHHIDQPLSNSYGMALWSRLPLSSVTVRDLLVPDVPSIRATVALRDRRRIALFALHPEPPVPFHPTEGRDAEIGLVGVETTETDLPAIVAGDLNDVAWSRTTRRFQRLSGLLDPRVGRGFYSSFDARFFFLRWPLDHLFHDARFRVVDLQRLDNVGSDHFPMYFALELNGTAAQGEAIAEASEDDHAELREMTEREAARDRRPVGEDWE